MNNPWSFTRPVYRKRRRVWLILGGIAAFIAGFFAVRPLFLLFGWL